MILREKETENDIDLFDDTIEFLKDYDRISKGDILFIFMPIYKNEPFYRDVK